MNSKARIEFGDFQTPLPLAREVCNRLRAEGVAADVILEPTCGNGTFLIAAAETFTRSTLRGWDINQSYVEAATAALKQARVSKRSSVQCQDFFAHDWEMELQKTSGRLLILGNLPWVTNSAVSALNGSNLPAKENFMGLRGIAARTGKSNFDISEWMLIRLVRALRGREATVAMLCKTATARKLLRYAWQNDGRIAKAALYRIDATEHFGASVDACLLLARMGSAGPETTDVFDSLSAIKSSVRMGLAGRDWVADIVAYRRMQHLEGLCPFQWRSGVKHDCAGVMELRSAKVGHFENKLGEVVELEPQYLFPLLKCTDLANGNTIPERFVVVTQRHVGDDTAVMADTVPLTWRYLQSHRKKFEARGSSIYKGRMPFALFGIGGYAFAPWKVAVSGLHRDPSFRVIGPCKGKPVFMDDTCYYLPFERESLARLVADILNSEPCRQFLQSLIFTGVKRSVTVDLLQRLNLSAIAEEAGLDKQWHALERTDYKTSQPAPQLQLVMETASRAIKGVSEKHTPIRYGRRSKAVSQVADKVGLEMPK
ncbi:MAG: SAM-dependent DNA methyltransferase [Verrucomicrobiia bacterium]